ncbi:hypothetical protein [Sinomonas terrae]|uniref:DNA modification methylase n=1 Tax=Sinomonas terrae TaxID=2908838 RepID=A0ABS9U4K3_9MICC|nr:hypothetical protein [Sinomonas terrae]MCH6471616.1 hypothetical protein [Sinomonas terrae]
MRFTASTPAKRVALVAAIGVGLLTATGCGYINPQQTASPYAASDGIDANVGSLQLRNALIASAGNAGSSPTPSAGAPGRMLGSLYNTSSNDLSVTMTTPGQSTVSLTVPSNGTVRLEDNPTPADFANVGGVPGSLVSVKVSDGTSTQDVQIPVLDGTLEQYRQFLPSPSAKATSSATAGATNTATSSTATSSASTATPSATASH